MPVVNSKQKWSPTTELADLLAQAVLRLRRRVALSPNCPPTVPKAARSGEKPPETAPNPLDVPADQSVHGDRLAEWFKAQARWVCDRFGENEEDRERRELAESIERRSSSVTVRELTHGLCQYRNATDAARSALDDLAAAGFGRWKHPAPGSTGGRPSPRFHLVASVTVTETPKDDPTSGGIGAGDDGGPQRERRGPAL